MAFRAGGVTLPFAALEASSASEDCHWASLTPIPGTVTGIIMSESPASRPSHGDSLMISDHYWHQSHLASKSSHYHDHGPKSVAQ